MYDLSTFDGDHLEASDSGVDVCEGQAGLKHFHSHHRRDEGDALLHSSTRLQREHPAGRKDGLTQNFT